MIASVFLEKISSPAWLGFWEWMEFGSIVIIGAGCAGEAWASHHKFPDNFASPAPVEKSKEKWERGFGWMVVGGLLVELVAFTFSFLASNHEIEGLRKANDMLEIQSRPRTQRFSHVRFANALQDQPRIKIELLYDSVDLDAYQFEQFWLKKAILDSHWEVTSCRPISATDITEGHAALLPGAPLMAQAGSFPGGIVFIVKDTAAYWEGNPMSTPPKPGTAIAAMQKAVSDSLGGFEFVIGLSDPRMTTDLLKILIGPRR